MALKQLVLTRKIQEARSQLEKLNGARDELRARREEMTRREAELEASVNEITEETAADEKAIVDQSVEDWEKDNELLEGEERENGEAVSKLEEEIDGLEKELAEVNARSAEAGQQTRDARGVTKERSVTEMNTLETRGGYAAMTMEQRSAFVAREDVKTFLGEVRDAISQKRAISNAGLLIPDVMLDLIRYETARASKLIGFVNLRHVAGTARQNIAGEIPEAVWTEMCAAINQLDLVFNQVEVDGYKVAGYIAVCNALLEDSDISLAGEIISAIGGSVGKALDKAILYGTGTKMPVGIVTRLAQTSEPANWDANARAWTDLHTTNVLKLNIDGTSGAEFFASLIEALAVAKPVYSSQGLFWVMNRKTHLHILAKALAFNSAAALVSNTDMMPVIGGTVVEFEDDRIPDNEIIGGFGGNDLMSERAGLKVSGSDLPLFLKDQTVFKGTARYDGKPVAGEAFVVVNFANTNVTTSKTFPEDYANADMNTLTLVAAAGGSVGKTVVTVTDYMADSSPVLKYKVGKVGVEVGDELPSGFEDLTSGSTAITAAAGKMITVVELDANDRIVSAGYVASVPKAS